MIRLNQIYIVSLGMLVSADALAVDSYRYLHVTIDTPWAIFLFLLPLVLSPFILMVFLYWRFAGRKPDARLDENNGSGRDRTVYNGLDQDSADSPDEGK